MLHSMDKGLFLLGKGDTQYTNRNALSVYEFAQKIGFEVKHCEYGDTLPHFSKEKITILLFFPYTFWNKECEVPKDGSLYGTSFLIYKNLDNFFKGVHESLCQAYHEERLEYIITPQQAAFDRDKIKVVKALQYNNISTTEQILDRNILNVLEHISSERGVFVKCRYGAEGKGITYLGASGWFTNYKVGNNKLNNYEKNERWPFTDITNRSELLQQILEGEVIIEKEIKTPLLKEGCKFDVRAYVVNGIVPHFFTRFNTLENILTNFSQGGNVKHHPLSLLPHTSLMNMREIAKKTAHALNYNLLGVDIMFDEIFERPRVVEVQVFSDFPSIEKFNMAEYLVKFSGLLR
ncbi:MAG: hypothetical protein Q8R18_04370 [bacterium]|nr:hypothetical protein [bacterium]